MKAEEENKAHQQSEEINGENISQQSIRETVTKESIASKLRRSIRKRSNGARNEKEKSVKSGWRNDISIKISKYRKYRHGGEK